MLVIQNSFAYGLFGTKIKLNSLHSGVNFIGDSVHKVKNDFYLILKSNVCWIPN